MSTERDELAELILSEFRPPKESGQSWRLSPSTAADKILAAGYRKPRTITTVEELNTVYAGCLIRESGGDLWSVDSATDRLFMIVDGADDTYDDDDLTLPATVLWEPLP